METADKQTMFDWKPEYSLGMSLVDQQHQALFKLADELFAAVSGSKGKDAVTVTLDRLVRYTRDHFQAEENLLAANNYPHLAAHKAQHDGLTKQVLEYQAGFASDRLIITVQVLRFVRNWLETHIMQEDRKYADYLKAKKAA